MIEFFSVLIVDDDPTQVAILSAYFTALKVEHIASACNSAEALSIIDSGQQEFDLIVTDLQMPRMDGLEFIRHLKEVKYCGSLVIISGMKDDMLGHAGRLANMHNLNLLGQIRKPLTKAALDSVFLKKADTPQTRNGTKNPIIVTQEDFARGMANGEIVPYYQPKVDVQDAKVIGAEALARWTTQDGLSIPPDVFIQMAETNDRIEELTYYLFDKALDDLNTFLKIDPNLKVAVNLAPEIVNNLALPDRLNQRIASHGISSHSISFEVTESSILKLEPVTLEVLSRLRLLEFEVAIDDFGTGSSNIQTLRDFPYSELKIDRSFITNALTNSFSRETVYAAVALAREQGMRVVAEGVEDMETWQLIRQLGIEHAQGFLLAKPLTAEHFRQFLKDHSEGLATIAA
ncbi:MAG: EAL domain-containing response regulator [Pseudomonadota bacterium]